MIKVNLLKQGVQAIKVGLKREISYLASEKGLEDLFHVIDVCLVGIHYLKGLLDGACWLDACKRFNNALLDIVKHPSDNCRVGLQPRLRGIRGVTKQ